MTCSIYKHTKVSDINNKKALVIMNFMYRKKILFSLR